jgi:hypothetical protein
MIQVARMERSDVDAGAEILFDAFGAVYRQRGHVPPFPTRDSAAWLCRAYLDLDPEGCIVAWSRNEAVGVGFAHPRGVVTSIGPLAARPGAPAGVARALMAEIGRVASQSSSLRLFQDSFNPDSFGLYARLGYAVADVAPYLLAEKLIPPAAAPSGVRALRPDDLPALERYDRARTVADRRRDLALLASTGSGLVATGQPGHAGKVGEISGYLFYRPLPARVVIGPGVAVCPWLPRRPPRQPDGGRPLRAAARPALRALPGKPLTATALPETQSSSAGVVCFRSFAGRRPAPHGAG